jgi:hydrogenase maturation protein HypF
MLPSNPLQHLLMLDLDFPVVATSGNLSDEPICADEREALARLRGIADFFLVHNRPIVRHVDDSIVRVVLGREMILRRARGYAPLPVRLPIEDGVGAPEKSEIILAVGAHLKNAVALAIGENVFLSQHLGDLATEAAHQAFLRAAADLPNFYGVTPTTIAADGHPDYLSTKFALARRSPIRRAANNSGQRGGSESSTPQILQVQHHVAHALSCLAENEVELPALGLAWDGTGYGADGTIWGSECFLVTDEKVERIAHLRPFRLPGGEAAVKEPRRAALGLLYELFGETIFEHADLPPLAAFNENERAQMRVMLRRGFNAPLTSSAGRLFDAVAALAGLRQQTRFEGQAAMELEFALAGVATDERYDLPLEAGCPPLILDWSPLMAALLFDLKRGVSVGMISAKFHNTLAEAVVAVAREFGEPRVALSGGCFQNRYLLERCVTRLRAEKFTPYWHQRVPPSDGGIALGQIVAARRARKNPAVENRKS